MTEKVIKLKFMGFHPSKVPGYDRAVEPGEILEFPESLVKQFELLNGLFEKVEAPQKPVKEEKKGGKKQ